MKNENQGAATTSVAPTQKSVSANEALQLLHSGKTRKEINQHFGLTNAEGILLWQHPKLKGRKFVAPVNLVVVDDIPEKEALPATAKDKGVDTDKVSASLEAAPEAVQAEEIPAPEAEETLWDRK